MAEFTDVQRTGPYVLSVQARSEMANIAHRYGLSFTHNPGGGEFYRDGFRCQISECDDLKDLESLRNAVKSLPEPAP